MFASSNLLWSKYLIFAVVNGLQKDRIKPVIETAIARFRMIAKMQSELDAAKQALSDRKMIDRAKGLLIRARGISEDEAYGLYT